MLGENKKKNMVKVRVVCHPDRERGSHKMWPSVVIACMRDYWLD